MSTTFHSNTYTSLTPRNLVKVSENIVRGLAADDRSMWEKIILPALGPKKVSDITTDDCDALHRMISKDRPTRANRVIEALRKALNLAIRSTFRDWASEVARTPREVAEMSLSHKVGSDVERADARSDLLGKRRVSMDRWSGYVSGNTAEIVRIG